MIKYIYIIILLIINGNIPAYGYSITNEISTGDYDPYRILGSPIEDEYWIVSFTKGLFLLDETGQNIWSLIEYNIGTVVDACGPDSNGYIYCCCDGSISKTRVLVFDTVTREVIEDINIGDDYITSSIIISPDESTIFVLGMNWPRVGEWNDSWLDANEHPLSGRIWMIDTTTYEVNPEVIEVGAHPYTIYYGDNPAIDKLFVCTQEFQNINGVGLDAGWHDVIELRQICTRTDRFLAGWNPGEDGVYNDMMTWSADDFQMALCNMDITEIDEYPEFDDGIWIIDTITNEVVRTITVTDSTGYPCGVTHMCISSVNPGTAYLGPGDCGRLNEILVLDMECGEVIDIIDLGNIWVHEKFIYEIPDGRLIVTGGISSNIVIIDPT